MRVWYRWLSHLSRRMARGTSSTRKASLNIKRFQLLAVAIFHRKNRKIRPRRHPFLFAAQGYVGGFRLSFGEPVGQGAGVKILAASVGQGVPGGLRLCLTSRDWPIQIFSLNPKNCAKPIFGFLLKNLRVGSFRVAEGPPRFTQASV
jgi:hypothetical protein